MTSGTMLAVALGTVGLVGLSAGANAAPVHGRQTITQTATGFLSLPAPPPIVGYPPQIYMNMLPPGAGPTFAPSRGFDFSRPDRRHDFHPFDRAFEDRDDR